MEACGILQGLPQQAINALVVIMCSVSAWAWSSVHPAFVTLLMLASFSAARVSSPPIILRFFTTPVPWMMIGSYLMAKAAVNSGLARRLGYVFMSRMGTGYKSLVIWAYVIGALMSLIIPQPFPRTMLIWALYRSVLERLSIGETAMKLLCFSVFSAAVPTSMMLLTGDSTLNVTAAGLLGQQAGLSVAAAGNMVSNSLSWSNWAVMMAVPSILVSAVHCALFLLVFGRVLRDTSGGALDSRLLSQTVKHELNAMGSLSVPEKRTIFWLGLAAFLWATERWHGIDIGWVALVCAAGLAMPVIGEVLGPDDINTGVNWSTLLFVAGASAIGSVASNTGIASYLASRLVTYKLPGSPVGFAVVGFLVTAAIHFVVGSAMTTIAIAGPVIIAAGVALGLPPAIPCLITYISANLQYVFPFQHITILVGQNEPGGYGVAEVTKMAVPLFVLTLAAIALVFVPWWELIGAV